MAAFRRVGTRIVHLALCVVFLQVPAAHAWTTRDPASWDTHDWTAHQSALSASAFQFDWVDVHTTIDQSQFPDASTAPTFTCEATEPGHADASARVGQLFDQAVDAYAQGDFGEASSIAGRLSHLMADLGDPSFAAGWSATDTRTVLWRDAALEMTDAAFENNGWVARTAPTYVVDPLAWAEEHRVRSGTFSNQVAQAVATHDLDSLAFRRLLAGRLDEITSRTSSILATIQARAQPLIVPVERLGGADRYGTAVEISRNAYPSGTETAILTSGDAWPDGIAATSLCELLGAPILLTRNAYVPTTTLLELKRLGARSIIIVGGTNVVSDNVANTLRSSGRSVRRIAGATRYSTSDKIAAYARTRDPASTSTAYVCTGAKFADALSISQMTAATGNVVLLCKPGSSGAAMVARARALGVKHVVIAGGSSAVSNVVETALIAELGSSAVRRLSGQDRYETAARVLDLRDEVFTEPTRNIVLASGTSFADGLVGGSIAGREAHGLLLSRSVRLSDPSTAAIQARTSSIDGLTLLGGTAVLSEFVASDVQHALDPAPVDPPSYGAYEPTTTVSYSPAVDLHGPTLGLYYVDRSAYYRMMANRPRDANRIIMIQYPDQPAPVYNPVTISQYAVGAYDEYLHTGSVAAKNDVLRHANWLRTAGMDAQGRFPYTWDYAPRGLKAPWYSGMAQGLGISAFLRAYQISGDESYLAAATRALGPYRRTVAAGGISSVSGDDLWLEEYTELRPTQVLNGGIFAMWGLLDLYRVTGDLEARDLFDRSVTTLRRHLADYEYRGSVLYERYPAHYCYYYYDLQIDQLRVLTEITGDRTYADRADRWSLMTSDPASVGSLGSALGPTPPAVWLSLDPLEGAPE